MKIRQPTNREDADAKPQVNRNNSTGFAADEALERQARPVERDFASVLRQSVKPTRERFDTREDMAEDRRTSSSRRDEKSSASERESAVERREQEDESSGQSSGENGSGGGSFNGRGGVADVVPHTGNMNARQILHVADLERIVAAVRTKLIADNQREVTIQLHRSVLAGLRVKVSQNESGQVTAEFIVANEAVRSQIEGRTQELAELLRGRGVNLAHIKTSIGEESGSSSNGSEHKRDDERSEAVAVRSDKPSNTPSSATAEEMNIADDSKDSFTTTRDSEQTTRYRA